MAALDIGTTLTNVETMLSGLSAWQSICGVSTASEAAERIHLGAIEDEVTSEDHSEESPCPFIILDVDPLNTDWKQFRSHGQIAIEVRVELAIPVENRSTYAAQYVWVWSKLSALLAGINGAVGGGGQLMVEAINMPLPPGPIDPDDNGGRIEWGFALSLVMAFI